MAEEGEVWRRLPHEIIETILSRLSVYDIVRVGCTCTRLRAFVSSHSFTSSSSVSLLLFVQPFDLDSPPAVAYDCTRRAWLKLSLSFLQPSLPNFAYPVASAGGLICFGSGRDFAICNPITRFCRRLPAIPLLAHSENGQSVQVDFEEQSVQAFGLICDCISGIFDFFVIHHSMLQSEKDSRMMHYSSSLLQWRVMAPLVVLGPCKLHSKTITPCNSELYTLWEKGNSLVVFAYRNGVWTEIEGPDYASTLLKAALLDVHGSLHMVGGVVCPYDYLWERPTSVCIWKLHRERMEWMEVATMPSRVLWQFHKLIDFDGLQWWGKNGVMYMKTSHSHVLTCDLNAKI